MSLRPLTDAELRSAYARGWRASWPVTFEEAMRDEVIAKIVETIARNVPALTRKNQSERHTGFKPKPQPINTGLSSLHIPRIRPMFSKPIIGLDQKRKASGERDNDD